MAQQVVIEHDMVGDPSIVVIADADEALIVYRRRLEELVAEHCDVKGAKFLPTENLERRLDDWRGNQSCSLVGLFLLEPEPSADGEEWISLSLAKTQDRALVVAGPLTAHVVRTDEGVVVDVWGHEDDDGPLATTWAEFNDARQPAAAVGD